MKIQLFNPPVHYYHGIHYQINPTLALPILCAVLRKAGHACEVTDLEALLIGPDKLGAAFAAQRDHWPDVIGFTCLTNQARGARDCIAALRAAGFSGKIAVGGVHATVLPEEVADWPGVDLVVTGEADANVEELLCGDARGIHAGRAPAVEDILAPDWTHTQPKPDYYQGNSPFIALPEGISMWSRGCPYACYFCGNSIFSPTKKRYRPPAHVEEEVRYLQRAYNIQSIFVYDDEMIGVRMPEGWMTEIADRLGPIGVPFKTQGRCSRKHITDDVLSNLYRAGGRIVMWGVESFSPRVLSRLGKGTTPEDNWHTLRLAKKHGLKNWVFSMIGNLEEGEEDLEETARCLAQAYSEGLVDYRQTTVVTAVPGTELWRVQKEGGWWHAPPTFGPAMGQVYHDTPWLSAARIQYWKERFDEVCPVGCQ